MAGDAAVIILDTHAWLWHVAAPERLSQRSRQALAADDQLGVCAISCWEIGMLQRIGRIALDREVRAWVGQALAIEQIVALPLSSEIALEAALVAEDFPGDPADRIIYTTARIHSARLLTKDRALRRFDPRVTLW